MKKFELETLLIGHVRPLFRPTKSIEPNTRPCGDLGICDEDLWELVEMAMDRLGMPRPTSDNPAYVPISQNDLTFADLADWLIEQQRPM